MNFPRAVSMWSVMLSCTIASQASLPHRGSLVSSVHRDLCCSLWLSCITFFWSTLLPGSIVYFRSLHWTVCTGAVGFALSAKMLFWKWKRKHFYLTTSLNNLTELTLHCRARCRGEGEARSELDKELYDLAENPTRDELKGTADINFKSVWQDTDTGASTKRKAIWFTKNGSRRRHLVISSIQKETAKLTLNVSWIRMPKQLKVRKVQHQVGVSQCTIISFAAQKVSSGASGFHEKKKLKRKFILFSTRIWRKKRQRIRYSHMKSNDHWKILEWMVRFLTFQLVLFSQVWLKTQCGGVFLLCSIPIPVYKPE